MGIAIKGRMVKVYQQEDDKSIVVKVTKPVWDEKRNHWRHVERGLSITFNERTTGRKAFTGAGDDNQKHTVFFPGGYADNMTAAITRAWDLCADA